MEEMAGKPKERHIRQPGERNMYERQRIETLYGFDFISYLKRHFMLGK